MRNYNSAQDGESAGPKIVGGLDQRIVQALEAGNERYDHEQQRRINQTNQYRGVVVQQFDGDRGDSKLHEQRRQDSGFPQQNHPSEGAYRLTDPEWDQAKNEEPGAGPASAEFRDDPGD